jgi:acetylornithine deacetylase/succinyl-diaminopimelate desuccinylase-like protein
MNEETIRADAVATMSRYVQFDTTNPPGNEMPAAVWLRDQLLDRDITKDVVIHEPAPGRGLVLAHIPGSEPLKPLLINHHMDVVAADPSQWTHPPFSGAVAEGFVWGRGTLDTKNLGVVFLLALESLLKEGTRFRRPIIFLAVPDEETGGNQGMKWLVENHLAALDPEWVWDEGSGGFKGLFGPQLMFGVAVAEKQIQHLKLVATGEPGHGSMPLLPPCFRQSPERKDSPPPFCCGTSRTL